MPLLDDQCHNDTTPTSSSYTDQYNDKEAPKARILRQYRSHSASTSTSTCTSTSIRQNASDISLANLDQLSRVSKSARSSEDSDPGTEADDEKGRISKHLLTSSVRGRKEWKDNKNPLENTPGVLTPVATPPHDRSRRRERRTVKQTVEETGDHDARNVRYMRGKKGEVVRGLVEVLLWLYVGYLNCRNVLWEDEGRVSREVLVFSTVVMTCYSIYPMRRTIKLWRENVQFSIAVRRGFRLPSHLDLGTLLYPVLLPLFVATAVDGGDRSMRVVNMVLGLSSLPQSVIPKLLDDQIYLHWLISTLPLVGPGSTSHLDLLFPLYETLTLVIYNLVTTSLDRSETFLLSTGLINLLILGTSPQAQILKALMWVGGLCLFLLCEDAIKVGIAVARIPSWRLARNRPSKSGIAGRLNHVLEAVMPGRRRFTAVDDTSSDEDGVHAPLSQSHLRRTAKLAHGGQPVDGMMNLTEYIRSTTAMLVDYTVKIAAGVATATLHKPNALLTRLTCVQAQALKYILALYTYTATIVTILGPVRWFVATHALDGADPFGWALGYLGGDWQPLRVWVVSNNIDWWIRLPRHRTWIHGESRYGWIDVYRQHVQGAAQMRLWLAGYCVSIIAVGIIAVLQLRSVVEVDTRRKVFHGVMVAMLLPTIPIDPCFFALALMVVLAIFLLLDLFRAAQLPPLARPLATFLAPYVDRRDHRGPVTVSPIFLLVGCAIPLWLSLACAPRAGMGAWAGWETPSRGLDMVSGVICVGMGDAAASLIGRRYGRTRWCWGGGKSVEGSAAFVLAVMAGLITSWLWLIIGGWRVYSSSDVLPIAFKSLFAAVGASLMESTLTAANDNVVVPIGLWLLVRGLNIG